jgi:DNA-binding GntR family transcriptional regulator
MGTSQGPVREALARLREQGLIISFPYRQTIVSDISLAEAQDAYAVRAILERAALQLALPQLGPKEFAILGRDVTLMEKAMKQGDLAGSVACDMRFHRRIYEWSGSPLLLQMWDTVAVKIRKFAVVAAHPVFAKDELRGVRSHHPLLELMKKGYSSELEAELDRHLSLIWMTPKELKEVTDQ